MSLSEPRPSLRNGVKRTRSNSVSPALSKRAEYPGDGLFGPQDTLHYDLLLLKVDPGSKP